MTKRYIDNALDELQQGIMIYERNENTIEMNNVRLHGISKNPQIDPLERSGYELIHTLTDANYRIARINDQKLREIDNTASLIAGYLSILIEECIERYSPRLKVIIRVRLHRLAEMREISVWENKRYICFPTAVAVLSPYLIKTRMSISSDNLVTIRQAIRALYEPSCLTTR